MNRTVTASVLSCSSLMGIAPGMSDTARYISDNRAACIDWLNASRGIGAGAVFDDLRALRQEAATAGWDGYDSKAISARSADIAEVIIRDLALSIGRPSLGCDPEGLVTIEWYCGPHWTLSITICEDGVLAYAGLFGLESVFGTFPASDRARLVQLVSRVTLA